MASKIEWTDETWNPVAGCTKCSPGCEHCYAERFANRLSYMGQAKYRRVVSAAGNWRDTVVCDESVLDKPLHWRKPRRIFVCSMSDLFHPKVRFEFIDKVRRVVWRCPQHTFLILTKRPKVLYEYCEVKNQGTGVWPNNVHLGVSISNTDEKWKITELSRIPAAVRFISFEPLLADVGEIPLENIHWVVVGGESGPSARPMHPGWVRNIRDQCVAAGVPFFFKQWGGVNKKKAGRLLDGREWNQLPALKGK